MKLTENSELIMSFLSKKNCVSQTRQTKKTKQILLKLYYEIKSANEFVATLKNKKGDDFYNLKITRINNVSEIPIPRLYSDKAFPEKVRGHINDHATYLLVYSFSLFQRNIKYCLEMQKLLKKRCLKYLQKYFLQKLQKVFVACNLSKRVLVVILL